MSTFGHIFRVTTAGESHCPSITTIIDGVPPRLPLNEQDIQPQLTRRRPGQSAISTPRTEADRVTIQSGTEHGVTLGSPIALTVPNENQRPKDYSGDNMDLYPRPSHADFTYLQKYGVKASSGGGRSSARETIARVAAGAVAEKVLRLAYGVEIVAFVSSIGRESLFPRDDSREDASTSDPEFLRLLETIDRDTVDAHQPVRCPSQAASARMEKLIEKYRDEKDSIGGMVTCVIRNLPTGLGEPCFDKMEALLAHAMLSIPATKGFSVGSGFEGCCVPGSRHNDAFVKVPATPSADSQGPAQNGANNAAPSTPHPSNRPPPPTLTTTTNNSGGIQGGITNGAPVFFSVAFKPPATIGKAQTTAGYDAAEGTLEAKGRHDPCVVPRALPIVEGMAACAVLDAVLMQEGRWGVGGLLGGKDGWK